MTDESKTTSSPSSAEVTAGAPIASSEAPARLRAAIGKLSRRLRHTSASSEMTPSEISVLLTVVREGPIGLTELANAEAINPTMLSRITGRLADLGLIDRTADPRDRRAVLVRATAEGTRVRGEIHRERTEALEQHIAKLGGAERDALICAIPALERLAQLIGRADR